MKLNICLFVLLAFLLFSKVHATHIKGGHIEYRQIGERAFVFTIVGYRDEQGILFSNGIFDFGDGNTYGDDEEIIPWKRLELENGVEQWEFTVTHTYASMGKYVVGYTEENRTEDVRNIAGSVNTAFHVEAVLTIDPLFGPNSSPSFSLPDFSGVVGQRYLTTFTTKDPDGDSLSYRLTTPLQSKGVKVGGYLNLNDPLLYDGTPGQLKLSTTTGNLLWETDNLSNIPNFQSREFNITVKVTQWRNNIIVGQNTIDYQVEIWNLNSTTFNTVGIEFPDSRCYDEKDTELVDEIVFTNPSQTELRITFEGSDDSFLVNDKTPEGWNEEMSDSLITAEKFVIETRSDRTNEALGAGISSLRMNVISSHSGDWFTFDVTQSQTLLYGTSCDFDALSIDQVDNPILKIGQEGITLSSTSTYSKIIVSDLSGKAILERDLTKTKTINYNFERNTVYLLTLVSDQDMMTTKFLIK